MTNRDIYCFYTTAQCKSITQASNLLYIAQPALTQRIQKMEKELGTTLLVRERDGIRLSAAGKCFYAFCDTYLRNETDLKKQIQDIDYSGSGEILLGFTGIQAGFVLPFFLPQFERKYPKIQITLIEGNSTAIEEMIANGKIDIGIVHNPVLNNSLSYFMLSSDDMIVVPRPSSLYKKYLFENETGELCIDVGFFREEPIAVTNKGQRSRTIIDNIFLKAGFSPTIKISTKNYTTIDALVLIDYCSTIMPSKQRSAALSALDSYSIGKEYDTNYSFYVATDKKAYLSVPTQKLVDFLKDMVMTF